MKIIFGFILLLSFFEASAVEIKISKMSLTAGMERQFLLQSSYPQKVILDCQSFIQGLTLGNQGNESLIMLEAEECEALYQRIESHLGSGQKYCLDVEDIIRSDYSCQ